MRFRFSNSVSGWRWLGWLLLLSCWQCQPREATPSPDSLLSLSFDGVTIHTRSASPADRVWTLTVPYLTNRRQLRPVLTLAPGASVVPRSGEEQDFTKPVLYTVTTAEGAKTVYQIRVQLADQPLPQLTGVSVDTLEAGQSLTLTGHSLGVFGPDVGVVATDAVSQTLSLATTWLDSTQVRAELPLSLAPGRYGLSVRVRGIASPQPAFVQVQYPSPQLLPLDQHYLRAGDTLRVKGQYLNPDRYTYGLQLTLDGLTRAFSPVQTTPTGLVVASDPALTAGRYRVQLVNRSEHKTSRDTSRSVQFYERTKPFITGIIALKAGYRPGDTLQVRTVNMGTLAARFYQVQLTSASGSYTVNGIYQASRERLLVLLPPSLVKGGLPAGHAAIEPVGRAAV